MITLTDQLIRAGGTSGRGWTKAQLKILGVQLPTKRGWIGDLYGKEISEDTYRAFLSANKNIKVEAGCCPLCKK